MATAEELRTEFTNYMDKEGFVYQVINSSDNIVRIGFEGRESKGGGAQTVIFVDFDEEGDSAESAHFVAPDFARCPQSAYAVVLIKLNEYNSRYRWVKFHASNDDDDGDVRLHCDGDAVLSSGTVGAECLQIVIRMSNIVEDVILDLGDLVVPDGGSGSGAQ